jgi:hypothetical protein
MIINKLDVGRTFRCPHETNPPLIIHTDRMLPAPVALECLQPVTRRGAQIVQRRRRVQIAELATRYGEQIGREAFRRNGVEGRPGPFVLEKLLIT